MTHWLDIVGVPEAGIAALAPEQRVLLDRAETIIGVPRRLAGLEARNDQMLVPWDGKLNEMVARILDMRGTPCVLLASGDPNWFGIGATLVRHLPQEDFAVHPALSSFQLAAARLNWPMQNVTTLSLHARPLAALHPHVLPGNRILALTTDGQTPVTVGALLVQRGYGASRLTVLENLGAPDEKITAFAADSAADHPVGDFHVLAIDCVADSTAPLLPTVPGLPDTAFVSDGQLTKREVRAATLAKLAPFPGALLWDVGAGSGSVGVEWMRAAPGARAICFECDPARCALIAQNRAALGTPGLEIVTGDAAQTLVDQPPPDALFLGGAVGNDALFEACWSALKPGGRLVANAVTLDAQSTLFERQTRFGGALVRIAIEGLDNIGSTRVLRPRMAVTQWSVTKRGEMETQ